MATVHEINFDEYIQLDDVYFVKPCENARERFDLFELKEASNAERYPDGKMDDVAHGLTLEGCIERVCHMRAQEDNTELEGYLNKLREVNKEIRETLIDYCK